jgi:acyl-CoA thioester hydrolase
VPELFIDHEVRPAFYDLDPLAVVWHGHYVRYFEVTRSALMQRFDYDYVQMRDSGYLWPIVDLRLKYVKPATLHQRLNVRAEIVEYENRLKIEYRISDLATGEKVTEGYTIQVAVDAKTNELLFVCPRVLWDKLGVST